jgi:hypothetical protein
MKNLAEDYNAGMRFTAKSTGPDSLSLAALLEKFANEQWLADHYTPEQAAAFILDRFKRRIASDLEMIELTRASGEVTSHAALH